MRPGIFVGRFRNRVTVTSATTPCCKGAVLNPGLGWSAWAWAQPFYIKLATSLLVVILSRRMNVLTRHITADNKSNAMYDPIEISFNSVSLPTGAGTMPL